MSVWLILPWWCITWPYANGNEPVSRVQGPWPRNRSMTLWYSVQFLVLFSICGKESKPFALSWQLFEFIFALSPHLPRKRPLPSFASPRTEMICRNGNLLCPPIEWTCSLLRCWLSWFWFHLSLSGGCQQSSISIEAMEMVAVVV